MKRLSLTILALAALTVGACSYTDAEGTKRSGLTGGALSDPACLGFNTYGQGCVRTERGNLVRVKAASATASTRN